MFHLFSVTREFTWLPGLFEYDGKSFATTSASSLRILWCMLLAPWTCSCSGSTGGLKPAVLGQWEGLCYHRPRLEVQGLRRHGKPDWQWGLRQRACLRRINDFYKCFVLMMALYTLHFYKWSFVPAEHLR